MTAYAFAADRYYDQPIIVADAIATSLVPILTGTTNFQVLGDAGFAAGATGSSGSFSTARASALATEYAFWFSVLVSTTTVS